MSNHAEVLEVACEWLSLKPRERTVLRNCLWARSQVENGNFLTTPSTVPSANRLIGRGYITKSKHQGTPAMNPKTFGMVVLLTEANWQKLVGDANATRADAATEIAGR